jgi:phosphatidylserine/phosphatidylglycerophosphate/cardiolipin synthase-like enzyme
MPPAVTAMPADAYAPALVPGRPAGPAPVAVDRTVLAHWLWRIGAAHVSTGNRVALLRDGPATFDAMCALIDGASNTVSLESYMMRSDAVGDRFAAVLTAAARRGCARA